MKTDTINPSTVLGRWARFLGAIMAIALMVPALAFSQPAAPTLDLPADAVSGVSTSPTLSWIAAVGDSVYHLQISMDNTFATTMFDDATLTSINNTITGLANSTTYYWRVSVKDGYATNGGGTSPYSTVRSFTTWLTTPPPTPPPLPVVLGGTGTFAVLSYAGITNTGNSSVSGDVGVSPTTGTSITGFNTVALTGTIYVVGPAGPPGYVTSPAMLTQAMGDLTTAYNDASGRTVNPIGLAGNIGGRTLYPGLYKSNGTLEISSGDLTLDAQGDVNAVWIFQIASSFNMTSGRQVILAGGALTSNIFWQVGTLASFGTTTVMKGTILAGTACTFATGASLDGRALAKTANVTLDANAITRPPIPAVFTNPATVVLSTAGNYMALAGTSLNIAATCKVDGNVGGVSVTNNGVVTGTVDINNPAVTAALGNLTTAISTTSGLSANATLGPQLAGTTLGRGVYNSSDGTFSINGTLILTGTATDIFIFQMTTTLTTAASSYVTLIGGALASNVFWQVGSSATLGANSFFFGTMMAGTSIGVGGSTVLDGKALAQTTVTLAANSALPVEIVAFTATANRMNAELRWSTATEVHNYGFEIERRQTADWSKVGFVAGAGSSSSPRDYSFADKNLPAGRYTYRLKQVDNSGSFSYYGSVEVEIGSTPREFALMQNYPNPFNPSTKIQYNLAKAEQVSLKVYNTLGSEVATLVNDRQEAGSYTVSFNSTMGTLGLASGMYIYRLEAGSFVSTKKLVLMK